MDCDGGFGFHSSSAHHYSGMMLQVNSLGLVAHPVVADPPGLTLRC